MNYVTAFLFFLPLSVLFMGCTESSFDSQQNYCGNRCPEVTGDCSNINVNLLVKKCRVEHPPETDPMGLIGCDMTAGINADNQCYESQKKVYDECVYSCLKDLRGS